MEQVGTAKLFFDVFPTLKVDETIRMLFLDVEVKKITTNPARDFLHVYIFSRHLLQKKQVWQMEQKIKEQLFGTSPVSIRIEEEYALSEQYTPAALMAEYRESIIQELKGYSVLAANMFEQAEIRFDEENVCCLELVDTIVSEGRREHIVNLLDDIFNRRCGIKTDIRVTYREKEESKTREYDEQRIQREINAIFRRNKSIHGEGYSKDLDTDKRTGSQNEAVPWDEAVGNGTASSINKNSLSNSANKNQAANNGSTAPKAGNTSERGGFCLLYTSDAADE